MVKSMRRCLESVRDGRRTPRAESIGKSGGQRDDSVQLAREPGRQGAHTKGESSITEKLTQTREATAIQNTITQTCEKPIPKPRKSIPTDKPITQTCEIPIPKPRKSLSEGKPNKPEITQTCETQITEKPLTQGKPNNHNAHKSAPEQGNQNSEGLTNRDTPRRRRTRLVPKPGRPHRAPHITIEMSRNLDNPFIIDINADFPATVNKPRTNYISAMSPDLDSKSYFQECHEESMIYSGAYRVGIYARTGTCSVTKPKIHNSDRKTRIMKRIRVHALQHQIIRKAKRISRKMSEPRHTVELKVISNSSCEECQNSNSEQYSSDADPLSPDYPSLGNKQFILKYALPPSNDFTLSNLTLRRAAIVTKYLLEAGDLEIEKAEANTWINIEMLAHELESRAKSGHYGEEYSESEEPNGDICKMLTNRAPQYQSNNSEVMTGYNRKIAPSVGARSLTDCCGYRGAYTNTCVNTIDLNPGYSNNIPKRPYDEVCTYAGIRAYDAESPYDKYAGPSAYTRAYTNADIDIYTYDEKHSCILSTALMHSQHAFVRPSANAYAACSLLEQSQIASATNDRFTQTCEQQNRNIATIDFITHPCELLLPISSVHTEITQLCEPLLQIASAIHENTHPCSTQISNAFATIEYTLPCGIPVQIASANKPEQQPSSSSEQTKKNLKNVLRSAPITGNHYYTKTSAVCHTNATSDQKGSNHLSLAKGERVDDPVVYPATASSNISIVPRR